MARALTLPIYGPGREWIFPWRYPANIHPDDFWWDLQISFDLVNWATVRTGCTGTLDVSIANAPKAFWRLKGRNLSF